MAIDKAEKRKRLKQLTQFHNGLVRYKELIVSKKRGRLRDETELQTLRSELQRKYGGLKEVIEKYGGPAVVRLGGAEYEAFSSAFSPEPFHPDALTVVMDTAIAAVNIAIGNLRSLSLPETGQVQALEDSAEAANFLFDKMQFHPKVVEASKSLFETGHYAQAIFEAFKAVEIFVQKKSREPLSGKGLMTTVFSKNNPIIKINAGVTLPEKDEQEGFMHLFEGAMQGIRNPKAHDNVVQRDPHRTLEYLGFASLLMQRVEEGEVKRPRKKRAQSPKS